MKAYIILAHVNAPQVLRLISRLDDGASKFFLHIDQKANINAFEMPLALKDKVTFLPRIRVTWADISMVDAALEGLRAIRKDDSQFDYVFLMSGQDYPIKSNQHISDTVSNDSSSSLEYFSLPAFQKWEPHGGLYRVNKYFFGLKFHQRYWAKTLNFASTLIPLLRRRPYLNMKPYAGSTWWGVNMRAADYILRFVDANPGYSRFHRRTFAPDEVFFHMILMNAPLEELTASAFPGKKALVHQNKADSSQEPGRAVVNDNKRYIRWENLQSPHPEVLGSGDITEIRKSNCLFARKFDMFLDEHILDLIDDKCLSVNKEAVHI